MFDLAKEVAAWSRSVDAERCGIGGSGGSGRSKAELIDHLYCEIDHARAQGLSNEQAFAAAIAKLGSGPELAAELAKNRSPLSSALAAAVSCERASLRRLDEFRGALIGHALIWAALILASSLILSKSSVPDTWSLLLTGVFLPCWWVSDQILRRALRGKPGSNA